MRLVRVTTGWTRALHTTTHYRVKRKTPVPSASRGVVERMVARAGTFKFKRRTYYVGYHHEGKVINILLSPTGKEIFIFHGDKLLARMNIDNGSAY